MENNKKIDEDVKRELLDNELLEQASAGARKEGDWVRCQRCGSLAYYNSSRDLYVCSSCGEESSGHFVS